MKLKGLRKILIGFLCATFIATGAVAYNGFAGGNVANADETPIAVSNDIQRIIDGYNNADKNLTGNRFSEMSAKYVKDYALYGGQTASGILITVDATNETTIKTSEFIGVPYFGVDVSNLTATDKLLGYVLAPSGSSDAGAFTGIEFVMFNGLNKGFTYRHTADRDAEGNETDTTDTEELQKVSTSIRLFNSTASYDNVGIYFKDSTANNYGIRSYKKVSFNGYQSEPHNIYYDYKSNTLYNDYYGLHDGDQMEFARNFSVDPKSYSSLGEIQVSPNSNPTDVQTLKNYTGSTAFKSFGGFADGAMRIGIRLNIKGGKKGSVLLTSYAGLDLTNPTNKFDNAFASINVSDVAEKFTFDTENSTAVAGSATTVGSNVTFNGIKLNVVPNEQGKATVTFDQVVDISSFTYANRFSNDAFIGMLPIPTNALVGTLPADAEERDAKVKAGELVLNNEFTDVRVILTDAHNETIKLVTAFNFNGTTSASPDGPNEDGKTYYNSQVNVTGWQNGVGGNDRAYVKSAGVMYGAPRQFSFLGYQQQSTKLIYDYDKNALFSSVTGNKNTGSSNSYLLKYLGVPASQYNTIADVDNGGYYTACTNSSMQDTWSGFTTGEVKLSIELTFAKDVTSGNLMITDVFGIDLSTGNDTALINKDTLSVVSEGLPEFTPAGEFTVPTVKYGTSLTSQTLDSTGDVVIKLNGNNFATKQAGDVINLNKPGKYEFIYAHPSGTTRTITTKVKANYNVVINGNASLIFNEEVYKSGDVIEVYDTLNAKLLFNKALYLDGVEFVDGENNSVSFALNESKISAGINDLPIAGTITATIREYFVEQFYVQGKPYSEFSVEQGENAILPTDPQVNGYVFEGWLYNGEAFNDATVLEKADDFKAKTYEITAKLKPIIYTANVYIDEAFNGMATLSENTGVYTMDSDLSFLPTVTVINNEYVFAGWYYNGKLVTKGDELPTTDGVSVYACFTKAFNEITYKDGNETIAVDKVLIGDKTAIKDISKEGFVLEGWYLDASKTQKYTFGSALNNNVTLYANWVKIESNVENGVVSDNVVNDSTVINGSAVGAFHNISIMGIIALALTGVGLVVAIVMGVLLIVKKRK